MAIERSIPEYLQEQLDEVCRRLDEIEKPKGSLNELVLHLQKLLDVLTVRSKAQNMALEVLLPGYKARYEEAYKRVQSNAAQYGKADYDSW